MLNVMSQELQVAYQHKKTVQIKFETWSNKQKQSLTRFRYISLIILNSILENTITQIIYISMLSEDCQMYWVSKKSLIGSVFQRSINVRKVGGFFPIKVFLFRITWNGPEWLKSSPNSRPLVKLLYDFMNSILYLLVCNSLSLELV